MKSLKSHFGLLIYFPFVKKFDTFVNEIDTFVKKKKKPFFFIRNL